RLLSQNLDRADHFASNALLFQFQRHRRINGRHVTTPLFDHEVAAVPCVITKSSASRLRVCPSTVTLIGASPFWNANNSALESFVTASAGSGVPLPTFWRGVRKFASAVSVTSESAASGNSTRLTLSSLDSNGIKASTAFRDLP